MSDLTIIGASTDEYLFIFIVNELKEFTFYRPNSILGSTIDRKGPSKLACMR